MGEAAMLLNPFSFSADTPYWRPGSVTICMNLFDVSTGTLFASVIWGAIGGGLCVFGWTQKSYIPLSCGVVISGFTYLISSVWLMSLASVLALAAAWWWKKRED